MYVCMYVMYVYTSYVDDHSRVKLIEDYNVDGMDYINASFIVSPIVAY